MEQFKKKEANLVSLILKEESGGLNIEGDNDISGILKGNESIKSNKDDPELLLYIKFKDNVNLTNFIKIEQSTKINITKILIDSKAENEDNKPDTLKIFCNTSNLDFSDVETKSPTELVKLEGKFNTKISINAAKFRRIFDLTLYFTRENSDFIQLDSIQFYGRPGEGIMNIGELKKKEGKKHS